MYRRRVNPTLLLKYVSKDMAVSRYAKSRAKLCYLSVPVSVFQYLFKLPSNFREKLRKSMVFH